MNKRFAAFAMVMFGMIVALGCTTGNPNPQSQFDDAVVATHVRNAIGIDSQLSGSSINVSVDRGVVTLRGTVTSPSLLERAGSIASQVEGVVSVRNELSVR